MKDWTVGRSGKSEIGHSDAVTHRGAAITTPKLCCPYCQQFESKVVRSVPAESDAFSRERRCLNCQRTYLTMETVVRLLKSSNVSETATCSTRQR